MGLFHFKKKVDAIQKDIATQQVGPEPAVSIPSAPMPVSPEVEVPPAPMPTSAASADPFVLPDLPPMPDYTKEQVLADPMGAIQGTPPLPVEPPVPTAEPVSEPLVSAEPPMGSLPELPELPDLPSFENHPEYEMLDELGEDEMIPVADSVEDSHLGKPFEDSLVEPAAPNFAIPAITKPVFLDVDEYQDILGDLNVTKSDLKHIHDRSELAEHESKIDTALDQFKKNILQAKKQLNHVDELLFMRG